MAHFIIAGRANDPEYARAEMLAHHLHANLPAFHITLVPKHPTSWADYVATTFARNRWDARMSYDRRFHKPEDLNQLVWRNSGELIGDAADFLRMMKARYNQELQIDEELLVEVSKENMEALAGKGGG
ncbi:putative malate dehydrogenase 1B [Geranomyces michiganensis]|nr:putative malate dehydrogenase 1B [Geranomyces michiganensis]